MLKKNKKFTLNILLGNLFMVSLGLGLVIPVLPTLMNQLDISGSTVGYLVSIYAITQFITSPFSGKWVDQYGRKPTIILGLLIFSVSELLFGLGENVYVLFISRILGGFSNALISPAVTAFIADVTSENERPKAMGYMSAAINTGFLIGPGIGGFLADINMRMPFFVAALFGALSVVFSFLLLKEPNEFEEKNEQKEMETKGNEYFRQIFHPMYIIAFLIIFISSFGLASFESILSLYVDHKFNFSPKEIAGVVSVSSIIGMMGQIFLFEHLTKKIGEIALIRYSLALAAIFIFLMTVANSYVTILLTSLLLFVGFDFIRPSVTTYLSKIAGNQQGFVGGMNSMFTSIGNIGGPIIGGTLFNTNINFPYYFATIVIICGTILTIFWKKPISL
ncbi:MFS transporter [Bacillus thuringiensis]|uniref:MFS transporter n=1 Tax=Bacillus cereus group TaxID=86661 RepID=UPI000BEB7B96|nr:MULTISPECIES: MFS transporter [Bacillus cereus group]PEA49827.1 MFS transporter [Bacillus thuringiensis]PES87615.1 MFS transporter [Bacillus thuringiensis]PEZ78775.1 MFS transporter [Bacillus thuringiensis]PFE03072.1 MFS transporter [Bacillus thuringiensis]PFT51743.1 MFS transporter [Bacillus thuringiensis]